MSKAEEEANKRYYITRGDDTEDTSGIDMQRALDFIDGYQQAEKDLELTWEDMEAIQEIANDYTKYHTMEPRFFVYKEVLKRFKDYKEQKV